MIRIFYTWIFFYLNHISAKAKLWARKYACTRAAVCSTDTLQKMKFHLPSWESFWYSSSNQRLIEAVERQIRCYFQNLLEGLTNVDIMFSISQLILITTSINQYKLTSISASFTIFSLKSLPEPGLYLLTNHNPNIWPEQIEVNRMNRLYPALAWFQWRQVSSRLLRLEPAHSNNIYIVKRTNANKYFWNSRLGDKCPNLPKLAIGKATC